MLFFRLTVALLLICRWLNEIHSHVELQSLLCLKSEGPEVSAQSEGFSVPLCMMLRRSSTADFMFLTLLALELLAFPELSDVTLVDSAVLILAAAAEDSAGLDQLSSSFCSSSVSVFSVASNVSREKHRAGV